MNSNLNNINKAGFKVPNDYFNTLEDEVINAIRLNELTKDHKETGFSIPSDYFDLVEDAIINEIKDAAETKVIPLFNRRRLTYISGIAAALIIAFTIFFNSTTTDELNYELVEEYIIDEGIDTYDLAALLTEEELTNLNEKVYDEAYNLESLEAYLLENVNLEELIEQ